MTAPAIDITTASKTYSGGIKALRGVALQVHRGEVFGLLGPNGAGKSTLVKILMTVINPTECRGTLLGNPIGDKPTLARVGYLPEHHRFPEYLSAPQVLDFYGALHGLDRRTRRSRIPNLLGMVGLTQAGNRKVRGFSKGMRQRLGIAQALINDPDLLLLDEPTDGVDPEGRRDIRMILADLRQRGKAVLINSHILAELEMICDRAALIFKGQLRAAGTMDELTTFGRCYHIDVIPPSDAPGTSLEELTTRTLPGAACRALDESFPSRGRRIVAPTTDPAAVQPLIDRLRARGVTITAVNLVKPTLEDVFMRTAEEVRGGEIEPANSIPVRAMHVGREARA